jgi:hypothetical protein
MPPIIGPVSDDVWSRMDNGFQSVCYRDGTVYEYLGKSTAQRNAAMNAAGYQIGRVARPLPPPLAAPPPPAPNHGFAAANRPRILRRRHQPYQRHGPPSGPMNAAVAMAMNAAITLDAVTAWNAGYRLKRFLGSGSHGAVALFQLYKENGRIVQFAVKFATPSAVPTLQDEERILTVGPLPSLPAVARPS